ncbi:MAG: cadherin-like domain-containing protein, partial [Nitrospinota bacterium]|nr:cadherin-like domain-containing protein [Nitrospinota bacterium]
DDTLTYTWSGPGGFTVQGQTGSFTIPEYGVYEFTCTVDDGQGGRATATASVSAPPPNEPPFVTSIQVLDGYTMTVPTQYWAGYPVFVKCNSMDPDGDQIYTTIRDQYGTVIGSGSVSGQYTLPWIGGCFAPEPFSFSCEVKDKWHAPSTFSTTIDVWGGC